MKTTVQDDTIGEESQITSLLRLPAFKYESTFDSKQFDLSNKCTFEPYDTTSYTVFVRENASWPPVDYTTHQRYSFRNSNNKLTSNGYFQENLKI